MNSTSSDSVCADCDCPIDESADNLEARAACSQCGGTKRIHYLSISDTAVARDGIGIQAKHPGDKKPYFESKQGPSYSHHLNKLVLHERVIDREGDHYSEKVTDYETGDTIHHSDELLSEHRNHGSAKKKP